MAAPLFPQFPHLLHGGDYNPDQWLEHPEVIDQDFRLFPLAGVNVVAIGIFSWAALEPEEGLYEFAWLDRLTDRLHAAGMRFFLATPSGAKPHWMAVRYPEIRRVDSQGRREPQEGRHNHCFTSPIYRAQVAAMNRKLAERYGQHPGLLLWHISNEYNGECRCDLCKQAFRSWLQRKYGTIDALNRRYWAGFWSHTYPSFEHIDAIDGSVHALVLDWRRFCSDQTADFMAAEVAALRAGGSSIPVTTNLMGTFPNLDYRRLAPVMDVSSWDSYPGWHTEVDEAGGETRTAQGTAFSHDLMRGMKRDAAGPLPWLLMESTPSQTNWSRLSRPKKPGLHRLASLQAVAHGADAVCYFQWRKSRGGCEKFHGAVVDHVGHEHTRVFREVGALGAELAQLAALAGSRVKARVAILHDWENLWAIDQAAMSNNQSKDYLSTLSNHHRAFWKRSIEVDVIGVEDPLDGYDLVLAPMLYQLREGVAARLVRFVEQGGTLVTTYLTGIADGTDLVTSAGIPGDLTPALGIWVEETDALPTGTPQSVAWHAGSPWAGSPQSVVIDHADLIHLRGAEVLATYAQDWYAGTPAITRHHQGRGQGIHVGARLDADGLDHFLGGLISSLSLRGALTHAPQGVVAHRRYHEDRTFLFVQNYAATPRRVTMTGQWRDLVKGRSEPETLELPAYGAMVLDFAGTTAHQAHEATRSRSLLLTFQLAIALLFSGASLLVAEEATPWKPWPGGHPTIDGVRASAVLGLAAEQKTGSLLAFAVVQNKRRIAKSSDGGATFTADGQWDGEGGCTSDSYSVDYGNSGRLAYFFLYGKSLGSGILAADGLTWTHFPQWTPKNFEVASVDWESTGKAILGYAHEDQGRLGLSVDGGMTWEEVGRGFGTPMGILNEQILFAAKWGQGLLRSGDRGKTWVKVTPAKTNWDTYQTIKVHRGNVYLGTETGVIFSEDTGITWRQLGDQLVTTDDSTNERRTHGPFFGKADGDIFLVCQRGVFETKNAGKSWNLVAPYPPETPKGGRAIFAWDSVHRVFHVARGGKPPLHAEIP